MAIDVIKIPDIGGAEGAEVIELCVAVGDAVAKDDSLVVLETDKASMEVPAPRAGKVVSINMAEGDTVAEGDIILELSGEAGEPAVDEQPETASPSEPEPEPEPEPELAPVVENPPAAATSTQIETVTIPDLGADGGAAVIEVCVAAGDEVGEGDSLVVLETDKASMEVPSPQAGKVIAVKLTEDSTVNQGDVIVELEVIASTTAAEKAEPKNSAPVPTAKDSPASQEQNNSEIPTPSFAETVSAPREEAAAGNKAGAYAGPAVRKLCREFGVELADVKGSGPKGRVIKEDVQAHVKQMMQQAKQPAVTGGSGIPPIPEVDFSQFGEIDVQKMSKLHKVTAMNMQRAWLNVPHVTQFDEADITDLEDFRKGLKAEAEQRGVKVSPLPFLLKACAAALKAHPQFNASLHADGEHIVYKNYVHIGVAVDTPAGLVVPVVRDVDQKSVWQLAEEVAELGQKAKQRKLTMAEMQGGCFTISSLGGIGGQGFTPIVNAPEVGILGVSKLAVKPVWNGSEFVPRKMLPLALSYDHRAVNGADAGRFFTFLGELLSDIRRLAL